MATRWTGVGSEKVGAMKHQDAIELYGIARVSLHVADLDAAAVDWTRQLGLGAPVRSGEGALFRLPGVDLELRQVPQGGSMARGTVEVYVAVPDTGRAARVLTEQKVRSTVRPDGVAVCPDDLNGVRLVLAATGGPGRGPAPIGSGYRGLSHIVVAVRDADTAVKRWTGLFRAPVSAPATTEHAHHIPAGRAWFGITATGTDSTAIGRFVERHGEGVYAVGLLVDDRDDRARGVASSGGRLVQGHGSPQVFVHPATTHGLLVELVPAATRV
jgi:methylmalonyl-CoA/ethylmalonyl-CoA epimerase